MLKSLPRKKGNQKDWLKPKKHTPKKLERLWEGKICQEQNPSLPDVTEKSKDRQKVLNKQDALVSRLPKKPSFMLGNTHILEGNFENET
jgi:hypothetical protein